MKEGIVPVAPLPGADAPKCDYCGQPAEKCTGVEIYPHRPDLANSAFYRCVPCGAYVGCHRKTGMPFGRLAKANLRAAKMRAHAAFDPLWKSGVKTRKDAYAWLAGTMGIEISKCHIGHFDLDQCAKVEAVCAFLSLAKPARRAEQGDSK